MSCSLTTFNIQYCDQKYWLRKREALADLLRSMRVDFLCLQEVSPEGMDWIRATLGHPPCVGVGREDGVSRGEHTPIFVLNRRWEVEAEGVFWLSPTPDEPSRGWDAACNRTCAWMHVRDREAAGRRLALLNLHLDHRGRRAREESVRRLQDHLKGIDAGVPAAVVGDFNFRDDSPAYAAMTSGAVRLADAARAARDADQASRGRLQSTWDGYGLFSTGRARIDYVFVDPRLAVVRCEVGSNRVNRRRISDHRPVTVEIDFAASALSAARTSTKENPLDGPPRSHAGDQA